MFIQSLHSDVLPAYQRMYFHTSAHPTFIDITRLHRVSEGYAELCTDIHRVS